MKLFAAFRVRAEPELRIQSLPNLFAKLIRPNRAFAPRSRARLKFVIFL